MAKAQRDNLGNRLGTQSAEINAVLGKKIAKTVEQIAADSGESLARVKAHIKYLKELERVEEVPAYKLKAKAKVTAKVK